MRKNTYYFSHDCNARNDEKILAIRMRHGAAGYGVYFMIVERLADEPTHTCAKDYNVIAFDLRVGSDLIKSVIEDFGLFTFTGDGERFYSESLKARMTMLDNALEQRREAGRRSAERRREAAQQNDGKPTENERPFNERSNDRSTSVATTVERPLTNSATPVDVPLQKSGTNEMKGNNNITSSIPNVIEEVSERGSDAAFDEEEKRGDISIPYQRIIDYWNEKTGGIYGKLVSIDNQRRKMTRARFIAYGEEVFFRAIDMAAASEFFKLPSSSWFSYDWLVRPNNFDKVIAGNYSRIVTHNGNTGTQQRTEAERRAVTKPTGAYGTDF